MMFILQFRNLFINISEIFSNQIIGCFETEEQCMQAIRDIESHFNIILKTEHYSIIPTLINKNLILSLSKPTDNSYSITKTAQKLTLTSGTLPTPSIWDTHTSHKTPLVVQNPIEQISNSECILIKIDFEIKANEDNKIKCLVHKKYYTDRPEERVRQCFLRFLMEVYNYKEKAIKVEGRLNNGKRPDIITYKKGKPILVVECKKKGKDLSQEVFDQVKYYNESINAPYIIITNGDYYRIRKYNYEKKYYEVCYEIPDFNSNP